MLSVRGVSKAFGAVTVLHEVDFDLRAGEIHALFGANGAGKSTLSRLISGHLPPTAGEIALEGRACRFRSPRDGLEAGIAMVMQETSLAPDLSVLENIFLPLCGRPGRLRFARLRSQAAEVLEQLGAATKIALDQAVGSLSAAQRQLVEIARALALRARVIVFDEPTTSLSPGEVAHLFGVMQRLRRDGRAMVFVSHRLEEVFTITDRVTVLRDGKVVAGGLATSRLTQTELVRLMIGRELQAGFVKSPGAAAPAGAVALQIEHLAAPPLVNDVSLRLHHGEILGLGGLVGAGRSETLEAVFGLRAVRGGSMALDGQPFRPRRPLEAIRAGLGYVAEDRRAQSIVPDLSVRENLLLATLARQRSPLARYGAQRARCAALAQKMGLPVHRLDDASMFSFSGGMQQKILIMRWLLLQPRVLLLDEPTKGIDVGTRSAIYAMLREIAADGVAILVVSSDFAELIALCDRIVPISDGRSIGAVPASLLDEEKLLLLAAPRSSMAEQRALLDHVAGRHDAAAFWAIVDAGSLICLAASEGAEAVVGFAPGGVAATQASRIPQALGHGAGRSTEADGTATLMLPVRNPRGHDLGLIGVTARHGMSAPQEDAIRADLKQFAEQRLGDLIAIGT
jgi:ABC-type sugar transport system ATPase subunit